jgi:4'-phosphopantetheinyl transferase
MDVYWLEQSEADVPDENDWLSASEILLLDGLRFAGRRADWRLGRWTAKRSLSIFLGSSTDCPAPADIEVRRGASGAPEVFFENASAPVTLSLSHRNNRALCAVTRGVVELGCDLELIEPRSDAFVADYFTAEEQTFLACQPAADRARILALLWSAKESALKALHRGLRLDTRCVVVDLLDETFGPGVWRALKVTHTTGQVFRGWWRNADRMVRTIVAIPAPESPFPLETGDLHGGASSFPWSGRLQPPKRGSALPINR